MLLDDLSQGIRALLSDGPIPDELMPTAAGSRDQRTG